MINIERVKAVLCSLSAKTVDELEQYSPIVKNAVAVISKLVDENSHQSEIAEYLAATKANYDICLASDCDNVTSFSAGNVRITQNANAKNSAKQILDNAMKDASDIICDTGFAFLGV